MQLPEDDAAFESKFRNKFKPIKVLGKGGYGVVMEVEDVEPPKKKHYFAVKQVPLSIRDGAEKTALREMDALLEFHHQGIVRFFDAWTERPPMGWQRESDERLFVKLKRKEERDTGSPIADEDSKKYQITYRDDCSFLYIKMELCKSTLADWLANNNIREPTTIKTMFKQIVEAVAYVHERRIHRDLNPRNIFIAYNNELRIGDFGIVTEVEKADDNETDQDGNEETIDRTLDKYSRKYMAPEQKGLGGYSNKVDVFALGLILAELTVVMTDVEANIAFDNYRAGNQNDILRTFPDTERLVEWMTRNNDFDRPSCKELLVDSFFETMPLSQPSRFESRFLSDFDIRGYLGGGSYGRVFEACHLTDKASYAVKRIPLSPKAAENLFCAVAHLRHENIVAYHTSWTERPPTGWQRSTDEKRLTFLGLSDLSNYPDDSVFFYLQMEQCTNSLNKWLAHNKRRDMNQMKVWFKQVVRAVEYIHSEGYIHRDLKPGNILIARNGQLKIADLDIVTVQEMGRNGQESNDAQMSRTTGMGTPLYMAPEQTALAIPLLSVLAESAIGTPNMPFPMGFMFRVLIGQVAGHITRQAYSNSLYSDEIKNGSRIAKEQSGTNYQSAVDIFALGLIFVEMSTYLSAEDALEVFDDFRRGKRNPVLRGQPRAERFVALLTDVNPKKRPSCTQILKHQFLAYI